jgi:hypothetical protein
MASQQQSQTSSFNMDKNRALDMQSLGLSHEDLNPSGPLSSRRALARQQSAQIMTKKFIQRDKIKEQMKREEAKLKQQKKLEARRKQSKWEQKLSSSPFTVNLVADSERLEEEHNVRLDEEARRRKMIEMKSNAAKQDIILRALQEESDLEALRREKRAIMEEEYRLNALLQLEKTNSNMKADRMAAQRAEKMRHSTKAAYKRNQNLDAIEDLRYRERTILIEKHDIKEPPPGTFGVPDS